MRLKFAVVSNKGGALLVSENAGDGKTSLLARLRVELAEQYHGNCRTVFIDHPTLTANQMVSEIARQIGLGAGTTDKLALLNELRAFLLACHEKGENCVVMLDEGQMLCHRPDILQELRILLNFCISDSFLLTFILSGQKPLDEAIRAMPEFYQRLPVRFFLRNLGRDDTRELIRYRLHKAGNPPGREIFSEDGYTGIYNFSKGCPRVICSVADLALVIAHSNFSDQVDFVSVSQACSDMNRTDGAYHYYHFLKSFSSPQSVPSDPTAGAPGGTYCANCGAARPDGSKFCPDCGHPVEATERPSAAEPPVSEPSAADQVREEMQADPSSVDVVAEVELPPEAPPAGEATGYLSETPSNGEDPLLAETAAEDQPYEDMETTLVSGEQALDSELPPEAPPAGETGDSPLEAQSGAEEPLPVEPASEIPVGKHCSNCGTELVEFAKFCFACGHPAAVQELETGLPPDIEELAAESAGEAAAGVEEAAANSTGEKAETGPAERKKPPAGETAGTEPSVGPEQEKISEPEAALPANPRSGSQLGRLLRFVLEGEENLGEAITDKNENSAEPVAESDNLKMDPEPEPLPAAAQVEEPPVVADPVDTRIELESAAESGEASLQAEEPPAPELKKPTTVKC
ncbi:MAG TPA: zinc-ribbon domain-containing protein [Candidatus Glassbacteria bacterium]|nr:zinc-ribbon domain-containing protein [Candidatus Glassbacteria bacterium]